MFTQRYLAFLRFLIRWEGATNVAPGEDIEDAYQRAMPFAFCNHPNDSGASTMMGVTMRVFNVWRTAICQKPRPTADDLRAMTFTEWETIVSYLYWQPLRADVLPFDCYALALADWHWHSGTTAIRHAQRLLGVEPDGIVGRKTVNAAKRLMGTRERARQMATQLTEQRRTFLANVVKNKPLRAAFAKGWDNRLDALLALFEQLDLNDEERAALRKRQR